MSKLINLPHLADQVFGVPHYATRQIMDSVKVDPGSPPAGHECGPAGNGPGAG